MCGNHRITIILGLVLMVTPVADVRGQALSIYEIQSHTTDGDASVYDCDVVDCTGGIVVAKFAGSRPRIVLQDPGYLTYAAIQVKDWTVGDLFDYVHLGDWVSVSNVLVEEFRGGTFLEWQSTHDSSFTIVSQDNPLPEPMLVSVSEIPAPLYDPIDDGWYVENHDAECYESMRLVVRDLTVTAKGLGKAVDNYNLQTPDEDDCWAADYMNNECEPSGYHRFVTTGQHFCAVAGVFEQYTNLSNGWDYYQLITTKTVDLAICGDGDSDGEVGIDDFPRFHACFIGPLCDEEGCETPRWAPPSGNLPLQHCLMMDLDYDGDVDLRDFAGLQVVFGAE